MLLMSKRVQSCRPVSPPQPSILQFACIRINFKLRRSDFDCPQNKTQENRNINSCFQNSLRIFAFAWHQPLVSQPVRYSMRYSNSDTMASDRYIQLPPPLIMSYRSVKMWSLRSSSLRSVQDQPKEAGRISGGSTAGQVKQK